MIRQLARFRRTVARSGAGRVLRALHLHRAADGVYSWVLRLGPGTSTVDFGGTPVKFRVTTRTEAGRTLGHWELDLMLAFVDALREGDVVYDIGANVGQYACLAGVRHGGAIEIHAFEADPRNAERLAQNLELNGITRSGAHAIAAGDENGETEFFIGGESGEPTSSMFSDHYWVERQGIRTKKISVPLWRLPDYAAEHGLPAPTVVKCDVEGAEFAVLKGLEPWLASKQVRRLEVELHGKTLERHGQSSQQVKDWIESHGYREIDTFTHPNPELAHATVVTYEAAPGGS